MKKRLQWAIAIAWGNPYTYPPDELPEVLAITILDHPSGPEKEIFYDRYCPGLGTGWALCCSAISLDPPRTLSLPVKQRLRRGRVKAKAIAKAPLFADQITNQILASNPDYFGVPS